MESFIDRQNVLISLVDTFVGFVTVTPKKKNRSPATNPTIQDSFFRAAAAVSTATQKAKVEKLQTTPSFVPSPSQKTVQKSFCHPSQAGGCGCGSPHPNAT